MDGEQHWPRTGLPGLGFHSSTGERPRGRGAYISVSMSNAPVWAQANPDHLPELRDSLSADVCVVGLGGSGLACIRELTAAGRDVIGLDACGIAAGAAGRNGGFLLGGLALFHHDATIRFGRRFAAAIYEETLNEMARMCDETPAAIRNTGSLRIADSAEELADCRDQLNAMRGDGLPVEWYDGHEGRGLFFPRDAAFDPMRRCVELARQARQAGARLFACSPATSVDSGTVTTPHGEVRAAHVVVAVDGGLEVIIPELASRVRSARLQMLATAPDAGADWPRPVYARWGLDYWQQLPDARIALGGGRDVGGDAEWTTEAEPTELVQSALTQLLRERLGSNAPVTHRWAATVAYTVSGMPVVEQVRPGVWAVGAYSGTGNVVGALCGRGVAAMIVDGESSVLELFRP